LNRRRTQRGVAGGLVVPDLLVIAVGFVASQFLSTVSTANRAGDQATAGLAKLAEAIEQFVASTGRLPCPADPALPETNAAWGDEAVPTPNEGACSFPAGAVPWRTIGARRDDAVDSWGWKVSYRVFSGTPGVAGSLTQANGVTMVECDTFEPTAGNVTALTGGTNVMGGLCVPNADTALRSSREPVFLANKGLRVTDGPSPQRSDVAFVLVSHGPTGLGGYTTAGNRNSLPAAGDELNNTNAAGPFVIKAFSAPGTDPTTSAHFDDRLFYRTLSDLVRRTNLSARNWPEPVAVGTSGVTFDRPTLEATSLGSGFTPGTAGSVGQVTVSFVGVVDATGVANGTATNISFGEAGGYPGIGVAGGGSALIESPFNEFIVLQFSDTTNTKFAATLGDFGTYGTFSEVVVFAFFSGGTNVATKGGLGCNVDGGLASFSMAVGTAFDSVAILSASAFDFATATFSGISAFLVSEVAACPSTATSCITSLTDFGNICSVF